jgi:hypothetical protein
MVGYLLMLRPSLLFILNLLQAGIFMKLEVLNRDVFSIIKVKYGKTGTNQKKNFPETKLNLLF